TVSWVCLRPRTRSPSRSVVVRRMQKTWPICGKSTYPFSSVLVQISRTSIRPWPLSVVVCRGGKSIEIECLDVLAKGWLVVFHHEDVCRDPRNLRISSHSG